MQHGLRTAISVPMNVCLTVNGLWPSLVDLAKICNISCKSDLMVRSDTTIRTVHDVIFVGSICYMYVVFFCRLERRAWRRACGEPIKM